MKKFRIGLQLYSVRDEMNNDMEGTIKAVAEMGYDCVEFAGYFGKTAEEVKAICDKYGIEAVSVHQGYSVFMEDPESAIAYLKTLGVKYCVIPWISVDDWKANYDRIVSDIKKVGALLRPHGIQLGYHNHDFELTTKHGDEWILDALYSEVPADILQPELDACWVHYAGCDPVEYILKYGEREEVLHLKDFECKKLAAGPVYALIDDNGKAEGAKDRESDGFEFRPIGAGRQDIKALFAAAEKTNIEYVIVEQDDHPSNSPLEDAKISIDYIRSIGY